jgi:hypothetical protein
MLHAKVVRDPRNAFDTIKEAKSAATSDGGCRLVLRC